MARDRRRASAAGSALTVPQLLNEAQRGAASAHVRYAKMLWELALSDANAARDQLLAAIKWFATVAEVRRLVSVPMQLLHPLPVAVIQTTSLCSLSPPSPVLPPVPRRFPLLAHCSRLCTSPAC